MNSTKDRSIASIDVPLLIPMILSFNIPTRSQDHLRKSIEEQLLITSERKEAVSITRLCLIPGLRSAKGTPFSSIHGGRPRLHIPPPTPRSQNRTVEWTAGEHSHRT